MSVREDDVRTYLWYQTLRNNARKASDVWSPEDTTQSARLGWMLANVPDRSEIELFILTRGQSVESVVKAIRDMAPYDYICGKAITVMTAQLMRHPNYPFTYRGL